MKPRFYLSLSFAVLVGIGALGAKPTDIDPTQRNDAFTTDSSGKKVTPKIEEKNIDEALAGKRFGRTQIIQEPRSALQEDQAPIQMKEAKSKTLITPERKTYAVEQRKISSFNGEMSRFNAETDAKFNGKIATRFQDRITAVSRPEQKIDVSSHKMTTFDRINRFIFRKNAGDNQEVSVKVAGSQGINRSPDSAPAPAISKNR